MTRRRIITLIGFSILVALLLGGSLFLRNVIIGQVSKRIRSVLAYDRIHLRLFPLSVVLDDVRTVSLAPFFSARQVSLSLPLASLLKNEKPLTILIRDPVLRISETGEESGKKPGLRLSLPIPFALEKAVVTGGELYYWGKSVSAQVKGFRAYLRYRRDSLALRAQAQDSALWLGSGREPLTGRIDLVAEGRGNQLEVKRLIVHGPHMLIKAEGNMSGLPDPEGQLKTSASAEMEFLSRMIGLPFEWDGRIEGSGIFSRTKGGIRFSSSLASDNLELSQVALDKVRGRLDLAPETGLAVDLDILNKAGTERVMIRHEPGKVRGEVQAFHLDPIFSYVSLPWPVRSPAWGNFSLDDREFQADIEFRDQSQEADEGGYPFRGRVRFSWDRKADIRFSSPQVETSFGRMEIDGHVIIGKTVDLTIQGDVGDVKGGRDFTSLVLSNPLTLPEIRGRGRALVRISGPLSSPEVRMDFNLSPAGFDRYDTAAATGSVEIIGGNVTGRFDVDDQVLRGHIDLIAGAEGLDVSVRLAEGEVSRILPGLNIRLPLEGRAAGKFKVSQRGREIRVDGDFSSPRLEFSRQELRNVAGRLDWDGEHLAFPRLDFDLYGGKVSSSSRLEPRTQALELDLQADNIELSSFSPSLSGRLFLRLNGNEAGKGESAAGKFWTENLRFIPLQPSEVEGEVRLSLAENRLGLRAKGNFISGDNPFSVEAKIPLFRDAMEIGIKGAFNNLDLLLPWKGAEGRLNYIGEIGGIPPGLEVSGGVDFQGSLLPFPQFAHALTDFSGLILVKNGQLSIRSVKGKLGGGNIQGGGEIQLGRGGVEKIDVAAEGERLLLSPLDRTRALTDVSLRLFKDNSRFVLDGDFIVQRLSWRREIYEKLAFSSTPYPTVERPPGFFDDLTLDLRLRGEDNAWIENSLGRVRCRFDLTVSGSVKAPIVMGNIETLSGEVFFQDRKFQILRGRVSFFNPASVEPYLDFRGETYVKDYRVTFTISGLLDQLKPEFTSSPPLPPEDVLALLALGEAFKRSYSADTSSQLSTASLLSFQLTEEATRRAEQIFSLDRFRIDPFLMGSSAEMTARLTVGKKISRDFYINYSTNLTRQTEEIIRLEWDISNEFSLVGTRNEFGRVSIDVKIRRRF
jgi:hypothetical protein